MGMAYTGPSAVSDAHAPSGRPKSAKLDSAGQKNVTSTTPPATTSQRPIGQSAAPVLAYADEESLVYLSTIDKAEDTGTRVHQHVGW